MPADRATAAAVFARPRRSPATSRTACSSTSSTPSTPEVQKAFYSLILDRRIGAYELPDGLDRHRRRQPGHRQRPRPADGLGAGQPPHPRPPARPPPTDWLAWAARRRHPPVDRSTTSPQRPDHLWSRAAEDRGAVLHARAPGTCSPTRCTPTATTSTRTPCAVLAHGTLTPAHAAAFCALRQDRPAPRTASRRSSRATPAGRAAPRTATCSTSWPRPSGPGW